MPGTQQMLIELPLTLALLSLGRMHGTETYLHGSFWKKKMRVGGSHTPTEQEKAQGPCYFPGEPQTVLTLSRDNLCLYLVPHQIIGNLGG